MAVVGPSVSGKTELIFKLLKEKTFYPRFKRAIFFYTESQPMYSEKGKSHNINIEFVKFNGFDGLRIKSAIATTAKIKSPTKKPTSVDSTNSPSSSSKTVKKRRGTKSTSLYQRGKKEDYPEDSDSYGTPYYDSDTSATETTDEIFLYFKKNVPRKHQPSELFLSCMFLILLLD